MANAPDLTVGALISPPDAASAPLKQAVKTTSRHLESLDYIRGVAILWVMLIHVLGAAYNYDGLPWKGWLRDFDVPGSFLCLLPLSFGRAGVSLFFVVSGFCIHLAFHHLGKDWGKFFIRRFFRIYPPYLAAMAFSLLVIYVNSGFNLGHGDWLQIWTHLCLVHNFHPSTCWGINAPFWSLAVEAQLYLLYPGLLICVGKFGWRRALACLVVCEGAIRFADGVVQTVGAESSTWGHVSWVLAYSPFGFWFSWAIGAFVADAFLKEKPLPLRAASPALWLCLAVGSYFFKPLSTFQFPLFSMATAATISRVLSKRGAQTSEPRLSLRVLKSLGLWSYSLYLLHMPLLIAYGLVINWVAPEQSTVGPVLFALTALTLIAVIPFSLLFYEVIELPAIALGKWIVNREGGTAIKASSAAIALLLLCCIGNLLISARFSLRVASEKNNQAWTYATNCEAARRNGVLAVKLAEDACRQTLFQNTRMVGTLAAAYAEAGRFDAAISAAQKACALASQSGDQKLLQRNEELLGLYLNHQAYHEAQVEIGR